MGHHPSDRTGREVATVNGYVDFGRLRPRNIGERILHLLMLVIVFVGMGAPLVAIGWLLLEAMQLLVGGA